MAGETRARDVQRLRHSDGSLSDVYDVALLDLDGVVYRGSQAIPRAVDGLTRAHEVGMRLAYVTNNASRPPQKVVERLRGIGAPVEDDYVVTSAQAAARLVSQMVAPGAAVLVVGGEGLDVALAEYGIKAVYRADDQPAAVVQGLDPELGWRRLAEGAYAVASGLPWVASNTDMTIPTTRGTAPGNGTLVAAITQTTGRRPVVAGKPQPPLFDEALRRIGGRRPLVVGDRLDTDIAGANGVGLDSLLVLTGVSGLDEVACAAPPARPTYVGLDLDALHESQPDVLVGSEDCSCEGITVSLAGDGVEVRRAKGGTARESTALVRAAVALAWEANTHRSRPVDLQAARDMLEEMVR